MVHHRWRVRWNVYYPMRRFPDTTTQLIGGCPEPSLFSWRYGTRPFPRSIRITFTPYGGRCVPVLPV